MRRVTIFILLTFPYFAFAGDVASQTPLDISKLKFKGSMSLGDIETANTFCNEAYLINARLNQILGDAQVTSRMLRERKTVATSHYENIKSDFHEIVAQANKAASNLKPPKTDSIETNQAMQDMAKLLVTSSKDINTTINSALVPFSFSEPSVDLIEVSSNNITSAALLLNVIHRNIQSDLVSAYKIHGLIGFNGAFYSCLTTDKMDEIKRVFIDYASNNGK